MMGVQSYEVGVKHPLARGGVWGCYMPLGEGGHAVAQLVETLRYKAEGRGFDSRWGILDFSLT
jgi:hypothetical protein